jgi:hypothetical protein
VADQRIPARAQFYIEAVIAVGATVWLYAGLRHSFRHGVLFGTCLALAIIAAMMKVRLPRVEGTFSLGFVGALIAIQELDFTEAVVVGSMVGLTQSIWRPQQRPVAVQVAFNVANVAIATAVAYAAYRGGLIGGPNEGSMGLLLWTATLFYVTNTGIVAGVLCLLEQTPIGQVFEHWCVWSLGYFLGGAVLVAGAHSLVGSSFASLALLPSMFVTYFVYRAYVRSRSDTGTNTARPQERASEPCNRRSA